MPPEESLESPAPVGEPDLKSLVREAIAEVLLEQRQVLANEELVVEKQQRASLEQRLNELVAENQKNRAKAEEADRHGGIRAELQKLGVGKIELAFRALKDDVQRKEDGRLVGFVAGAEVELASFVKQFIDDNPELLPARRSGGAGLLNPARPALDTTRVDLDRIQPGMSAEELERVRQEIVRVANQAFRGM